MDINIIVRQFSMVVSEVTGEKTEWVVGHIDNLENGDFIPNKEISDALREVMIRNLYPDMDMSDIFDEEIENDEEPITIIAKPERIVSGKPPYTIINTNYTVFRSYSAYSKTKPGEYHTSKSTKSVKFEINGDVINYSFDGRSYTLKLIDPSLLYRNGKLAYIEAKQTDSEYVDYILISVEENWIKMKGDYDETVYY